ncbi:MAG: sn-glycerol-1-phosphate dehydrogenase [Christensenellales bacterium]|nr:sn-glycerol-1-phosphate dehydrogenase [Christensenellales bacterium]
MPRFDQMSLEALVRPEGYQCDCGRHHRCAMDYLKVGRGVIRYVPEMLRAMGKKKPYVVCDIHTYAVAGERVCALLDDAGIDRVLYVIPGERIAPAEWEIGSALMHFDVSCDVILAVGSGVVNDICKVLAHAVGVPSACVGTAPSMDGYASSSSSMEVNHVKVSLYGKCPAGILLDSEIMAQAPLRMLWAGLGDMVAKYIALCEWRIAAIVTDEYYCEAIASLMRTAMKKVVDAAEAIPKRDPDAVQAIAEGLLIAGVGMAYAGISRPASGLEHYFSHMWEMMALERNQPYDLHGIQVGVGTVLTMKLYRRIREIRPDRARGEAHMKAFRREDWEAQVRRIFGKTAEEIIRIEEATRKNDPARHAVRLKRLCDHWDEILRIMEEELPDDEALMECLTATGMPVRPSEIGISSEDVVDAFLGARDIRDKYLSCSFLWDLGLTDTFARYLEEVAEN